MELARSPVHWRPVTGHESQWASLGACAEAVRTEQRQRLRLGLTRDDTAPHLLCTGCVISHIWCSEEERSTAEA